MDGALPQIAFLIYIFFCLVLEFGHRWTPDALCYVLPPMKNWRPFCSEQLQSQIFLLGFTKNTWDFEQYSVHFFKMSLTDVVNFGKPAALGFPF